MTPGGTRTLLAVIAGALLFGGLFVAVLIDDDGPSSRASLTGSVHQAPGQPPHLSAARLRHIEARHWPESDAPGAGKFAAPMSAQTLLLYVREADAAGTWRPNTGGRPGRLLEYDLGRKIGTTIDG